MPIRIQCKKNKYMAVLTIAVSAVVALPVLLLPVGLREGTPADLLVGRAYAAAYPYDPNKTEVLVEQWALTAVSQEGDFVDGLENPDDVGGQTTGESSSGSAAPTDAIVPTDAITPTDAGAGTTETPFAGELIEIGEGQTVSATYIDGQGPSVQDSMKYEGIMTATIVQHVDEDGRPVEILAPDTFLSDDTTVYIKTSETIIKESPEMDSVTVASINKGKEVVRIALGDTWAKIRTEDGIEGYVPQDNLSEEMLFIDIDRTVWVDADGLKLRAEPSTASEILKTLSMDTPLHCSAVSDKWYRVVTASGTEGYVYISYTTQDPPPTPVPTPAPKKKSSGGGSSGSTGNTASLPTITGVNGESIVNICISMLGVQYEWSGESRDGVDCSGLVVYAYRQVGISLPHQSNSQKSSGISVSRSDIAVGDIVCWDMRGSSDTVEHVGIYVGNGQVIHASSSRDRVEYGSLDMYPIVSIRRIIA